MKGILLAGGRGTRLYPATGAVSKHLLAVYDKPMIYYPLSTLMLAGIREVLVISAPGDLPGFARLLGDGSRLGMDIRYAIQEAPRGVAEALLIGEAFIGGGPVCLALGDNILYGEGLPRLLERAAARREGATVFGCPVEDPRQYGVLGFGPGGAVASIEEKPRAPQSHYAVPGLYFYDGQAAALAKTVRPSERGELEITAVNSAYLGQGRLHAELLGRGVTWLDAGTPAALLKASAFVEAVQARTGRPVACIEEIAWRQGFISRRELAALGRALEMTDYGQYLISCGEADDHE